jgi:hypothetical protein
MARRKQLVTSSPRKRSGPLAHSTARGRRGPKGKPTQPPGTSWRGSKATSGQAERPARRRESPQVLAPVEVAPEEPLTSGLPSSLGLERHASAAQSGRAVLEERVNSHKETGPAMTGGDVDADWVAAYSVGDEAPGGDNPTPDQDVVDEIGKALGVEYSDEEELDGNRLVGRDRHRWELDPASSEDYPERLKGAPRARTEGKGREGREGK